MSAPLRRVLLRRPSLTRDFAAAGWRPPDVGLLARQHEAFGQLLTELGCEVEIAPARRWAGRCIYVRDPGLVTGAGVVLFQMTKPARAANRPCWAPR
jgi:N-dimethylarginine dimethylaminohydrolase